MPGTVNGGADDVPVKSGADGAVVTSGTRIAGPRPRTLRSVPAPDLLSVPDAADALGIAVLKMRQLIGDGTLLAVRDEAGILRVPADFVAGGVPLKGLAGVLTLLRDSRYTDDEALRWLYTPDDSLPGTPAQALLENRGTEVKRRAQALGW